MFCANCGKEIREGSRFCSSCGEPVKAAAPPGGEGLQPPVPPAPFMAPGTPSVAPRAGVSRKTIALIVVGIVGGLVLISSILVAIAVPVYLSSKQNAQRRTCRANLRTIDGEINAYWADNEKYPESVEDLVEGGLLRTMPTCPKGPKPYELEGSDPPHAVCPNDPTHTY